jgi:hypothetical protein
VEAQTVLLAALCIRALLFCPSSPQAAQFGVEQAAVMAHVLGPASGALAAGARLLR